MPTFTTIQDANTTPVTAPGTGPNPITVQNTRTNNTPRYLYTTWGEEGWAKAPAEFPETGYSFSCYFTIAADADHVANTIKSKMNRSTPMGKYVASKSGLSTPKRFCML